MNGMDFVIKSALLQFGKRHTHAFVKNARSIIRHSNPTNRGTHCIFSLL
jgi:hypothetical protein